MNIQKLRPTSFCRIHASFIVVVTFLCSIFFVSPITKRRNLSVVSALAFYLSLQNNRYCNQALAMMLETDTGFEQNSFDQEYFSLCLESEDTIKERKTTISFFFRHASLIVYLSWNKISYWIINEILSSDGYTIINCYWMNSWIPKCQCELQREFR